MKFKLNVTKGVIKIKRRNLNLAKYGITAARYNELYWFCMGYNERKQKIADLRLSLSAVHITGLPYGNDVSKPTENRAVKIVELEQMNEKIEQAAEQTDKVLSSWILVAVTNDYKYTYMRTVKNIPCNEKEFLKLRRVFYYHLDKLR